MKAVMAKVGMTRILVLLNKPRERKGRYNRSIIVANPQRYQEKGKEGAPL
jgi:hypothetical protein